MTHIHGDRPAHGSVIRPTYLIGPITVYHGLIKAPPAVEWETSRTGEKADALGCPRSWLNSGLSSMSPFGCFVTNSAELSGQLTGVD